MIMFLLLQQRVFPIFDHRSWLTRPQAGGLVLTNLPDFFFSDTKSAKSFGSVASKASQTRSRCLGRSIKCPWSAEGQSKERSPRGCKTPRKKTVRKLSCLLKAVFSHQYLHAQFILPTASEYPFLSWMCMQRNGNTLTHTYAYTFHITRFEFSHTAMGNLQI